MANGSALRTIRILDPATVNRIAAGEVVERPASVVKELLENAIDAGAQNIRIEITSSRGAISGIRVTDDGSGMSGEDALLAFTPHATSKIRDISDLDAIRTLGFRGEALSSIAAVSRVILCTKLRGTGAVAGTKVVAEGGVIREHSEIGIPEGTSILVRDLFYNTPVRKKFLKSLATELARVISVTEGLALAYPEISLRVLHNGNERMATEHSSGLLDTITRVMGSEVTGRLLPVGYRIPFMSVSGYISRPSLFRKNPGRILIAVNRRSVSSPHVAAAVLEGYGTLLSKDRFPIVFLSLDVNTSLVDVNVHPAKKLVRFSREPEICAAVRDAVSAALLRSDLIPAAEVPEPEHTGVLPVPQRSPVSYSHAPEAASCISEPTHAGVFTTERQLRQTELFSGNAPEQSPVPELDVIGQLGGIYILASTPGGELILIDQHAAHERIMFELVSARPEGAGRSQELIMPLTLHRSARDAAVMRELLPLLGDEGFVIDDFGGDTFLVRAVPAVLGRSDQTELVNDIIDDLTRGEFSRTVSTSEQILRIVACRGAIKAGTVCTDEQCRRLVRQLRQAANPFTCPHGRPTMVRFSRDQLDAMFLRT
jgi:DNA mismatch repair protein MutL